MARKHALTNRELYALHVANLQSIDRALRQIELLAKDAIKKNRSTLIESLLCAHALLVGAWVECRLKKLLHEEHGFKEAERAKIMRARNQQSRWKSAILVGFRRRYQTKSLTINSLGHAAFSRYKSLLEAIEKDIGPIIEIRNKLAHGQWEYLLTDKEDKISEKAMKQIKTMNLLASKFKLQIVSHIASLVHDLVVSKSFERDFDAHFRKFIAAQNNLKGQSYQNYVEALRARYQRGQQRRVPA